MKSRCNILTFGIAGFCLLTAGTPVSYAQFLPQAAPVSISAAVDQQAVKVSTKAVKTEDALIAADLSIPVIEGLKDARYQAELNDLIYRHAMEDLESLKKQAGEAATQAKEAGYEMRPYELNIQYKVKADGGSGDAGRFSIEILTYTYTGGAHGGTRSDHYNVLNEQQAKRIELKDLFGDGYTTLIDEQIRQEIAKDPERYFKDGFKGISGTQNFYIDHGNDAVIVFSEYEIAPYASGRPEFRIPIPGNGSDSSAGEQAKQPVSLPAQLVINGNPAASEDAASMYKTNGGIIMLPLRATAEALGYTVKWNAEQQAAELIRGSQWTVLHPGKDEYVYNKMAPFPLGAAPAIQSDGKMYVPLSFFSNVLKAEVTGENGVISIQQK